MNTEQAQRRKIIRFSFGVILGLAIANGFDWQLAYIMPILLTMLLSGPAITLRSGILFTALIFVGTGLGLLLTLTVINFPLVCLLTVVLLMFHIFYAANQGLPPLAVVMLLMGITAIPIVGMESVFIAQTLVQLLVLNGLIAVALAIFSFWLLPNIHEPVPPKPEPNQNQKALVSASISTLVMLPLIVIFYSFTLSGAILVFMFSAILAQTPNLQAGIKGSSALLIANSLGGIAAISIYGLLIGFPEYLYFILIMLLVTLLFAQKIFSTSPSAALYSTAFTAVLLLVGSSIGEYTGDATANFIKRILQIAMAGLYIVTAFYLLNRLFIMLGYRQRPEPTTSETDRVEDLSAA